MTLDRAVTEIVRPVEVTLPEGGQRWVCIPETAPPSAFPLHRLDDVTLEPAGSFSSVGSLSTELLYPLGDGFTYGTGKEGGARIPRGSVVVVRPGTALEVGLCAEARASSRLLQIVLPASGMTPGPTPGVEVHAVEESRVIRSARTEIRPLTKDSTILAPRQGRILLHVRLWRGAEWAWSVPPAYRACVYVLNGAGRFGWTGVAARPRDLLVLGPGERFPVRVRDAVEFLLVGVADRPDRERSAYKPPKRVRA